MLAHVWLLVLTNYYMVSVEDGLYWSVTYTLFNPDNVSSYTSYSLGYPSKFVLKPINLFLSLTY